MDLIPLFFQAAGIGFAVAVPLGPLGLFCVERTLSRGTAAGLSTGLGVAVADGVWCALLAFGARWLSDLLLEIGEPLRIGGGLVVALLGLRILLQNLRPQTPPPPRVRGGAFLTAFGLTFFSPMTPVVFLAIFAGLGMAEAAVNPRVAVEIVAGIFLGSLAWWTCLTLGVARVRHRLAPRTLAWINRCAGVGLIVFGAALIVFG